MIPLWNLVPDEGSTKVGEMIRKDRRFREETGRYSTEAPPFARLPRIREHPSVPPT